MIFSNIFSKVKAQWVDLNGAASKIKKHDVPILRANKVA
jgi:hypothetical protein